MSIPTFMTDLYAFAVARAPAPLASVLRPKTRKRAIARKASGSAGKRTFTEQGRDVATAHFSWYRGEHTNYNPTKINLFEPRAIDEYFLNGWLPGSPFISKKTPVVAFGSCFAEHISRYLRERGFNILGEELGGSAYIIRFGEGMVNSFAIRQQLEWGFEGRILGRALARQGWTTAQT